MENFIQKICLSDLYGTIVTEEEIAGVMEEGIFIPFKFNPCYRAKGAKVYIQFYIQEKYSDIYGQSHMVKPLFPQKRKESLKRFGININAIVGNLKRDFKSALKNTYNKKKKTSFDDAFNK